MPTLEFALDPADTSRLLQWPGRRAARSFPATIVWHDTPQATLASNGLTVSASAGVWRLTQLRPLTASSAPELHSEARRPALLDLGALGSQLELAPQAQLDGTRQTLRLNGPATITIRVLSGATGGTQPTACCRLTLDGDASAITALALALAQQLGLHVPRATLAAEALAAARHEPPEPRALGAPLVRPGLTASDSLAHIISHLLDAMLHWADRVPTADTPEPVHQMRVATRRLRSALTLYRKAAACPDLDAITEPLKACAARLGVAREWDVFIGGLGARLGTAFPGDKRCRAMLRAATARRAAAYADLRTFLAGPEFRVLTAALSCAATLRPWDAASAPLGLDTAEFATCVLDRRAKRVRHAGRKLESLSIPALHELRKDCKRLRYAAEFFISLFPAKRTKRFIGALSDLQEELGLLNDTAAVSGLMAQLGRLEHSWAAGLVEGFSAAHAAPARGRIERAWKRFRATDPFWPSLTNQRD